MLLQSVESQQVAVVANPYSGRRHNRQHIAAMLDALRGAGLEPVEMWDKGALAEAAKAPDFAERYRCVIAAGGDGTIFHVLNHRLSAPLAIFPMGNENLVARQFGWRRDPQQLASSVQRGYVGRYDLGEANGQRFALVASAGFDGEVAHRLAAWRHRGTHLRRVGRLSYARPILAAAMRYAYPMMSITTDGTEHRGSLVMVFNIPQYGLNLPLAPQADPTDGLLDYVIFHRPGTLRLIGYAMSVMRGRHGRRDDVTIGRAAQVRIEAEDAAGAAVEIDGDAAGFTPIDIAAAPGALAMIEPVV